MTSATNEAAIRRRDQQAKRDRVTDEVVIKSLMSHKDGRRWVWNQLEFAQMFVGDVNLDPYYMAFEKGRRNTGLKLLKDVQAFTSAEYLTMTSENTNLQLQDTSNGNGTDPDPDDAALASG